MSTSPVLIGREVLGIDARTALVLMRLYDALTAVVTALKLVLSVVRTSISLRARGYDPPPG